MDKKKKNLLFSVIGVTILVLIVVLLVLLFSNKKASNIDNAYGDFNKTVVTSEELDYVLEVDMNKYTRNAIEEAFDEYFLPIYPSGIGLGYVSYESINGGHSLRLIDSYGTFHSLTILEKEESIQVMIDEYEKTFKIEIPDRGDED